MHNLFEWRHRKIWFLEISVDLFHKKVCYWADIVADNIGHVLSLSSWVYDALDIEEMVWFDGNPDGEPDIPVVGNSTITYLTLRIWLALIENSHALEILLKTVHVFEYSFAVGNFFPSQNVITVLKTFIKIIIFLDKNELMERTRHNQTHILFPLLNSNHKIKIYL